MAGVRPSALPCTRLRDSCVACAVSKLKCSKQRPACSRCEARGIDCQYFFARRPGRRREHGRGHPTSCTSRNSRSSEDHSEPAQGERSSNDGPPGTVGTSIYPVDLTADPSATASLPGSHGWTANDADGTYPADAFLIPGESSIVPQLGDSEMDLLMAGSFDHPPTDPESAPHTLDSTTPPTLAGADFDIDPTDAHCMDALPADPSAEDSLDPNTQPSATATSTVNPANTTAQSCICVPCALALLRTLSCAQSSSTSALPETHPALYTLIQHKPNIVLARRMLSCPPCAENTFLLAILSLIVLNILEQYATALRRQLHDTNNAPQANGNGSCVDPGTVAKMAHCIIACRRVPLRVIVSELCRLQSLVNHLAPRLAQPEALERMEGGLREGLGGLSVDIIERLRRY
ncbi:hypothetical protein BDW75DRAFT_20797 [Aspergillus navahoensis]